MFMKFCQVFALSALLILKELKPYMNTQNVRLQTRRLTWIYKVSAESDSTGEHVSHHEILALE